MKKYDKHRSLTFTAIYLNNNETLYFASYLEDDAISKEAGMEGLRRRLILNKYLGQYNRAIIFCNRTKRKLETYNANGINTYSYEENRCTA